MNYKLRPEVEQDIRDQVALLLQRRVAYTIAAFPLDAEEIRQAVMTDEQHALTAQLTDTGFNQFRKHRSVSIYVPREDYPGMRRSAALHLTLPEEILLPRAVHLSFRGTKRITPDDMDSDAVTDLYKLFLNDEQKARLATWSTRIIRDTRLQAMGIWAVNEALKACKATGHLLALWPMLATLVTLPSWRSRFRDPPRKLRDYAPNVYTVRMLGTEIPIIDTILNASLMLEQPEPNPRAVIPNLVAWEWLDRDRSY